MKSKTEKRLLLALLACSLWPLAALSGFAASQGAGRLLAPLLACSVGAALLAALAARRLARPWIELHTRLEGIAPGPHHGAPPSEDGAEGILQVMESLARRGEETAERARATEQRFRDFIEMNPDGVAIAEAAGRRLLLFNRSLCQMLRRSPDDLAEVDVLSLFAQPEDAEDLLRRLREAGKIKEYEVKLLRGDGSPFAALFSMRLADHCGATCVEAIVSDISSLKESQRKDRDKTQTLFALYGELSRAHEALRKAYGEVEEQVRRQTSELRAAYNALQDSDRVRTDFLMRMSHELRTPLNCIIGYSEAMIDGLDGLVNRDQSQSLTRIAESGKRLLRMIENLLDLSRLEAGRVDFLCTSMRVEDALEDVLHQTRSLVGGRPIALELTVEEPLPQIWADPDRVRQVVFNLVGNALKFTREGLVRVEARRSQGASVEVRVCDTGPGVPEDYAEAIFESFTQVPGRDRTGAGLGLSICREFVERMGGKIWVEPQCGRGSVFAFTLPLASARGQLSLPLG